MIMKALRTLVVLAVSAAAGNAGAITLTFESGATPGGAPGFFEVVPFSTTRFYLAVDGIGGLIDLPSIPTGSQLSLEIDFLIGQPVPVTGLDQTFLVAVAPFDAAATPLYPAEPATTISGGGSCGLLGSVCEFGYSVFLDGPYSPPALVPPVRLMAFDVVHDSSGAVGDSAGIYVGVTRVSVVVFDAAGDAIEKEIFPQNAAATLGVTAIPEPSTAWLAAAGLVALAALSTRRRTRPTAPAVS